MEVMNRQPMQSKSPSPDLPDNTAHQTYETVATLPLSRFPAGSSQYDSMVPLPEPGRHDSQRNAAQAVTQPTQLIRVSSPDMPTSPPTVQVAASSPTVAPPRRQNSILASIMAPAGTVFRRPYAFTPPQPPTITIDSDDEGPQYKGGGSSDSDRENLRKNDIKASIFIRKTQDNSEKIPESPRAQPASDRFRQITSSAFYDPNAKPSTAQTNFTVDSRIQEPSRPNRGPLSGIKRSGDVMANSYGNVKRPKQSGPSRAQAVVDISDDEPEMELDDIQDFNLRKKTKHLASLLTSETVRSCYGALLAKKGNFDDATDYLLLKTTEKKKNMALLAHVDLTGSEDELLRTPAQRASEIKQQAKKPAQSIQDKWGSTQHVRKPLPTKTLSHFEEPKKGRKLVRGRKERTPPAPESPESVPKVKERYDSDGSDADSGVQSAFEDKSFNGRLLAFFNTCSVNDLMDTAALGQEIAAYLISKRPFKTLNAVSAVPAPNAKQSKRKAPPVGERIVEKCEEMIRSYEAIDYLVKKCENIAKPLTKEMQSWGVKTTGLKDGELDLVSIKHSPGSSHDSGIGTPVSDIEEDKLNTARRQNPNYIGQPSIMADGIQMKDYQVVGVNWLALLFRKRLSAILADDMGLGKTCQVIAFFAHLLEVGEKGPHLVVVPAATLENWLQEFQRFCPTLRVEPYYANSPKERLELAADIEEERDQINVVITTYTVAKAKDDSPWLRHFGFCCTVFDEGHQLKNAESQVAYKLSKIQSKFRLLLTGTPLQNNLKELISLLGFLMPVLFKEKKEELQAIFTHNVKAMDDNHEALLSAQRIARARSMLTPFILRRKKYQVLKDLPKKERRVEYCDMTPEQSEIYTSWLEKAQDVRDRRERGENVANESSNILMKLRQAAIHPFLFRRLYQDNILPKISKTCIKVDQWAQSNPSLITEELMAYSDFEIHRLVDEHRALRHFALNGDEWRASGKVQKMLELLHKFMAEGHRTLVFSQFTMVLDILELVFEREAINYFRLDGNTKVAERQDLIDEFCSPDNDTPVFMLSTKAGGAGINLAKANKVIVFDSGFNPQDDVQAENRAHRIGQIKEVEVVRLVSRGTVEEQIYAMGLTKLKLDEQVAGDGEDDKKKEDEGKAMIEEMLFGGLGRSGAEGKEGKGVDVEEAKRVLERVEREADDAKVIEEKICARERTKSADLPSRTRGRPVVGRKTSRGKKSVEYAEISDDE